MNVRSEILHTNKDVHKSPIIVLIKLKLHSNSAVEQIKVDIVNPFFLEQSVYHTKCSISGLYNIRLAMFIWQSVHTLFKYNKNEEKASNQDSKSSMTLKCGKLVNEKRYNISDLHTINCKYSY